MIYNQSPLVSIVVVAYNCADVIAQNIESCLKEKEAEILLIDNASIDGTLKTIEPYAHQVTLIRNNQNLGFTKACNQGIEQAKGKYILLLNPDAWLADGSLQVLVNYLAENETAGAVAPSLYYPNGDFQNYTRTFPTVMGLWVESFVPMPFWNKFKSYGQYTCQNQDFTHELEVEQPAGAAILFRNQWVLDEHYFIYCSDVDLCKTIYTDGYKIIQLPNAKVFHHQSKGGTENQKLRLYLDLDNYYGMTYYFRKHQEQLNLWLYRFLFAGSLLIRAVLAFVSFSRDTSVRWKKFIFFLQHKNFTSIHE